MSAEETDIGFDPDDENFITIEEMIEPLVKEVKRKRYSFGIMFMYAIGIISFAIAIWQLGWGSPACQQTSCQYDVLVHLSVGLVLLFFAAIVLGAGYLFQHDWREKDDKRVRKEEAILEKALLELEEQGKVPHNAEKLLKVDPADTSKAESKPKADDDSGEQSVVHFND